jgi:hypothetical protein
LGARAFWTGAYLLTRALGLALLVPQIGLLVDFTHVRQAIEQAGAAGAMPEYPWLAVALHELPLRFGITKWTHYYWSMVSLFLLADAAFTVCLWRAGGRRASPGLVAWLLVFPVLGPLLVTRFDIVAGALAACALIARGASRPALSGALAAAGCGVKLWPALAFPALVVPGKRDDWRRVIGGAILVAGAIAVATFAAAGLERLWSPFMFQARRSLQVEAFAALPLLWARHFGALADGAVVYGECKCYEVNSPWTDAALPFASGALWLGVAGLVLLYLRALRAPEPARTSSLAAQLTVLSVIVWIATNKAFSPQYLVWVAAPLAALGVLPPRQLPRADIGLFLLACALTQFVFPSNYHLLLVGGEAAAKVLIALTIRDALLITLGVRLAVKIWRATGA